MKTILIIDDEAPIREMLRFSLELANFSVLEAETGERGIKVCHDKKPDLILLDWMLPDQPGISVVKSLRENNHTANLPIILLTALAEEENKIRGLKTGADDYVVKPFSTMELIARIQAVLRRTRGHEKDIIILSDVKIDTARQRVYLNGSLLKLTSREYKLLLFFVTHPDKIFSREKLLNEVWGDNTVVTDRSVDVYIRRLRKFFKRADLSDPFITERNAGYRFHWEEK